MRFDAELLEALEQPTLHLYTWHRPSITYGYFIKPDEHLNLDYLAKAGIDWARRPTGGGIVFHTHDLAFSLLLPKDHPACGDNTLERYHWVNRRVLRAIEAAIESGRQKGADLCTIEPDEPKEMGAFCMARPTHYDVMWRGGKVGGAAQRKKPRGLLHQGTICLQRVPKKLLEGALCNPKVAEAMERWSAPIAQSTNLEAARHAMREELKKQFL